ncbi:trehalose-6-phosphate synthase [Uliginosibacterium sp. sgz301328]|uniref:alpha,alpha-trehalose-phosphate synthase (UDP-forming) n=1 Tax=Uliginosibacterium sp. sgz301328 TaxID=3243764 RepID=UPI00359D4347
MNTLRLQLRFIIPLLIALAITAYVTVPLVDRLTLRWSLRDLDTRSHLIASTLDDTLVDSLAYNDLPRAEQSFARVLQDERILALGLCDRNGSLVVHTQSFPDEVKCPDPADPTSRAAHLLKLPRGSVHVTTTAVGGLVPPIGTLVLVHDVSYAEKRSEDTRKYFIGLFIGLGAMIALITMIIAQLSWRGWVAGARAILRGEGLLRPIEAPMPELRPLAHDMRMMLRELDDERRAREELSDNQWQPQRLRKLLHEELRGDEVIVVSNREPYIHEDTPDGIVVRRPASGLVTAVEPVMRACSGTWIAHGSGSADRKVVDRNDCVPVPPDKPAYKLKRVWLTEADEAGYYYGFANEGLWPLCHVAHVRPVFRIGDWERYRAVNQRFADAVVAAARTDDPVVLVQDYHFALLPKMVREKLPRATIITFWHIPWPNPESFGICPWRKELLEGMLGSTILGFHTRYHCKNFLETVDRFLEARIEHEHTTVTYGGRDTLVKSYPISIHWPTAEETAVVPPIAACRAELRERLGVAPEHCVAIGVDRFDYTKGILERVNAVERMLEKHPSMVGRFSLVQIAAPTRSSLDEYRIFRERLQARVEAVNARFGFGRYLPIHLLSSHHEPDTLVRYYRGADACVVTSLHDGMNLVSKEFIAARDDEQGVLVLSQFAGAAHELLEALIVNPYHVEETADALYRALTMPAAEQGERMRSLRYVVREYNVYRWAGRMLIDAARFRRRGRIEQRLQGGDRQ